MKSYFRALVSCLVITVTLTAAASGIAKDSPDFVRITPADVHWQDIPDGHGAQQAVLLGDPNKPGIYVVRAKFPPHVMDRPHWHPTLGTSRCSRELGTPARAIPSISPGQFL